MRAGTAELPLKGIKVLDLSRVLAGPYCTMMLGDLGAEVFKVERPHAGDDTRHWGPPFVAGESAYYLCLNRNKKSLTANMKTPEGVEIIKSLSKQSDILIENFKVGTLDNTGLEYRELSQENPGLIYCSITGFGQNGPYKDKPGYDFMIQGMGGLMSFTGEPDGPPMKVGVAIVDITAGLFASSAILAALRHREKSGEGQYIDISLLDSVMAWLANVGSNYLVSGENPVRYGNAHPNIVPYQTFKTADGHVILTIGNDQQFERFCKFADAPDLLQDTRFTTNADRVVNRDALIEIMVPLLAAKPSDHWLEGMEKLKIGCGPINNIDGVFSDPQVNDRDMVIKMPHTALNGASVPLVGNPLRLSETAVSYRHPPPLLGEHTDQVLSEVLGTDEAERKTLREAGVI